MSNKLVKYEVARDDAIWMKISGNMGDKNHGLEFHGIELTAFNARLINNNGKSVKVLVCRSCEEVLGQITDENIEYQSEVHSCSC
jgi:hypothetical protein